MSRTSTVRTYGRRTAGRTKPLLFFTEVPISPTDKKKRRHLPVADLVDDLADQLTFVTLDDTQTLEDVDGTRPWAVTESAPQQETAEGEEEEAVGDGALRTSGITEFIPSPVNDGQGSEGFLNASGGRPTDDTTFLDTVCDDANTSLASDGLRVLTWADMCPPGDRIEKIAEASYAEVYRVTNARGTSIIKAMRLASPIRPQTKAQVRSGLVDEEPHAEEALRGELTISEWLADIPGFVVYKERYIVRGRAPKELLETHQAFHRRAKRQDPGRLQFYPSPSRYLDDTQFLVIELGDAGRALENVVLESASQLWDVFLHVAIALARAEDQIKFEHRDLHEGNLCVRQVAEPREKPDNDNDNDTVVFGYSGLDITILDYGLSRAEKHNGALGAGSAQPIAFDLEADLGLFTSTHASQCKVYRQMRSYLLKGDRVHLPPDCHQQPYAQGPDGRPISWQRYTPYTNVLWLAYLYAYLVRNFCGDKQALTRFKRATRELWLHLNPDAPQVVLSFASATDVVRFALEAGWLTEAQLVGGGGGGEESTFYSRCDDQHDDDDDDGEDRNTSRLVSDVGEESCGGNESIIEAHIVERDETQPRRSPRRRRPVRRYDC
ncbi:Protein kinase-like domain protein [Niveomyces insectorum RCEF 264]|uniref:non-specific serine/threonine protein kinase n=1 Tax=Niveomyces insectorum RCEF 264 TaxID=1081102 RepID=A0A167ZWQ1_9HYPO|nr:Protein kinase-like domain protein [Niveomyces insectorum RCEF 264]